MCSMELQSPTYQYTCALYKDVAGGGYAQIAEDFLQMGGGGAHQEYADGTLISYLDSPSTTSELSYRPYCKVDGSGTLTLNYSATQGTMIVMEILA